MKIIVNILLVSILLSLFGNVSATDLLGSGDDINIVYFGGSITQGSGASSINNCWASLVTDYFKSAYADKKINGINAGMGGTGSDMGLFRLEKDVLSKSPDLVFVEFAVNDRKSDPDETVRFMEGIVRNLQKSEKPPMILFLYTTTDQFDSSVAVQDKVAKYYGIPTIDLQAYIKSQVASGKLDITKILKDGVHPNDEGYKIYADYIINLLKNNPSEYLKYPIKKEKPLDDASYEVIPRFEKATTELSTGNWKSTGAGISSETPGDKIVYDFSGTMLALQNRISAFGGKCSIDIDGKIVSTLSTYYNVNDQSVMWYKNMNLASGDHRLTITVLDSKDSLSKGNTITIDNFIIADGKKSEPQPSKEPVMNNTPSIQTAKVIDSGIIYDTSYAGYLENGMWTTSNLVGFKGNYLRYSDVVGASAAWNVSIQRGIYKLFYWKGLSDKGAANSTIKPSCTTATEVKPINFQRGVSGWTEIGTYFVSDGAISVTVSGGDGRIMTSALKFVKADDNSLNLNSLFGKAKNSVMLKIGSQKAFVKGTVTDVPDVAPTVQGERTLVPIRFISEGLGAKVDWDNTTKTATILIGDSKVAFTLDRNKYLVNDEEKTLDQPAILLSDRMMIPLRAFSDSIGKQLFWDDRGLIIIADTINIDTSFDGNLIQAGIDAFN